MPKFRYIARDMAGKSYRETIEAPDERELIARLRAEGKYTISVKEVKTVMQRSKRLKPQQLGEFCRQLGTLLDAGVSLVRALNIVANSETISDNERASYSELLRSIRQGIAFSDAMDQQGDVFPELLINMFRTAEASGNMNNVALRMAVHYEKSYRLNKKVSGAMVYPGVLMSLIVVVIIFIVTFILPQFEGLFERMGDLPGATQFLIDMSDAFRSDWLLIIVCAVMAVVFVTVLLRIPSVKMLMNKFKLHAPIAGKMLKVIYTARFARTMSSLYSSGLPIVSSLTVGCRTLGNIYIERQFEKVISRVRSGEPLSLALLDVDGFIRKLSDAVMIGEETGNLDGMLESTAESLEYDSEMAIAKLVSMLEPMMIVIMALVVGFVMLAVMVPIFQYYQSVESMTVM